MSSSRSESHVVDICCSWSLTALLIARGRATAAAPCKRDVTVQTQLRGNNSTHSPAGRAPGTQTDASTARNREKRSPPNLGLPPHRSRHTTARATGSNPRELRVGRSPLHRSARPRRDGERGGGLSPWRESRDPASQGRERAEWEGDGYWDERKGAESV